MKKATLPREQIWSVRGTLYTVTLEGGKFWWRARCPRLKLSVRESSYFCARSALRDMMMAATLKRKGAKR